MAEFVWKQYIRKCCSGDHLGLGEGEEGSKETQAENTQENISKGSFIQVHKDVLEIVQVLSQNFPE